MAPCPPGSAYGFTGALATGALVATGTRVTWGLSSLVLVTIGLCSHWGPVVTGAPWSLGACSDWGPRVLRDYWLHTSHAVVNGSSGHFTLEILPSLGPCGHWGHCQTREHSQWGDYGLIMDRWLGPNEDRSHDVLAGALSLTQYEAPPLVPRGSSLDTTGLAHCSPMFLLVNRAACGHTRFQCPPSYF